MELLSSPLLSSPLLSARPGAAIVRGAGREHRLHRYGKSLRLHTRCPPEAIDWKRSSLIYTHARIHTYSLQPPRRERGMASRHESAGESVVLEEELDENYEPTEEGEDSRMLNP